MTTYVLRRIVQAVPVLLGISVFTFLMAHLTPGDPVYIFAGDRPITEERAAQIRHQYGLDKPLWAQYRDYMTDLVRGDLGSGLHSKRPVWDTIREAMWPTIQLTLAGLVVAVLLGVTLGILAAIFHNSWLDTGAMVVALLGVSMPIFYLGLLLLFAFSFNIHLFPATAPAAGNTSFCRRSPSGSRPPPTSHGSCARRCWRCCARTTSSRRGRKACGTASS